MTKRKSNRSGGVIRRSVVLPKSVIREVISAAPPRLQRNLNRLVRVALVIYTDQCRERQIDKEMIRMGKDPHVLADCRRINAEFACTDSDGLKS